MSPRPRAEIIVDLDAVRSNVRRLRELVAPAALIVVVKADGYGHGMAPVARAARSAGADWLAVATPDEAVALRDAGDEGPLMCWLAAPGDDYRPAIERGVTLTAYDVAQLEAIAQAGTDASAGAPVDVQLKLDTGLSRGGVEYVEWPGLLAAAIGLRDAGRVRVVGTFSHFACSDEPEHPANDSQERVFREAVDIARRSGLDPGMLHLANSAAALLRPSARFDAVRVGLAAYGLNPAPGVLDTATLGLRPVMTARATIAKVRNLIAGDGIGYGHTYVAADRMHVGLVPAGYGDGIPRNASPGAEVQVLSNRCPLVGRVSMDQVVIDLTAVGGRAGDDVVLFGPGADGEPTALDWALACETISYEIVTRIGGRFARTYRDQETSA